MGEQIKVFIRLRWQNQQDDFIQIEDGLFIDTKPDQKIFQFDYIFDIQSKQDQIYQCIGQPILQNCLDGFDSTVFVYGQTGTGKTFTMSGKNFETDNLDRGLQQRILENLFQYKQQNSFIDFSIKCSYFEIFNEQIFDLLSNDQQSLQIRENQEKGVYIEKLYQENILNINQGIQILKKGQERKSIASHAMNQQSSRSHTILQLTIEQKNESYIKTSKLNLVDLAGSERQKKALTQGQRLKEAGSINKSLSVLGNVINALSEKNNGKTNKFISFRDSKLTFFLRDSLSGNSKTSMIATLNSDSKEFSESLSTLKFAQRVKSIQLETKQNLVNIETFSSLKDEIQKLKQNIYILQLQKNVQGDQQQLDLLRQEFIQSQNELEVQIIKNDYLEQKLFEKNNELYIIQDDYDTLQQSYNYQKFQIEQLKYQFQQKNKQSVQKIQLSDIQQLRQKLIINNQNDQKIVNNIQNKENFQNLSNIQNQSSMQDQLNLQKRKLEYDNDRQFQITNFFGTKLIKK